MDHRNLIVRNRKLSKKLMVLMSPLTFLTFSRRLKLTFSHFMKNASRFSMLLKERLSKSINWRQNGNRTERTKRGKRNKKSKRRKSSKIKRNKRPNRKLEKRVSSSVDTATSSGPINRKLKTTKWKCPISLRKSRTNKSISELSWINCPLNNETI